MHVISSVDVYTFENIIMNDMMTVYYCSIFSFMANVKREILWCQLAELCIRQFQL